jgi:HlyD family secretion protein
MAEPNERLFREKSLERLSSPERLDQLLQVVDRKSWLPLLVLSLLILALGLWSVFGHIPVNVEGRGILVRPRELLEIQAPGSGYLTRLNIKVNDVVQAGDVLAVVARPDLDKQLELQHGKLRELASIDHQLSTSWPAPGPHGGHAANGQTPASPVPLQAMRALTERLRDKNLQSIREEQARLEEQRELARTLANLHRERLEAQRQLQQSGLTSRESLIEAEADYMDSLTRISGLEADLRELRTKALEIEEQYLQRLERIADRGQQFADVQREIARLEHLQREQGRIVTEHGGRILEVTAAVGQYLEAGTSIGLMTVSGQESPLLSVSYFTVRDGKRLEPSMDIQVTPDTVERQRYGSIRGVIQSVSSLPVTLAEAQNVVGNREVAEALVRGGYQMQVTAVLERDRETASGFHWTSSRGPEMTVSAGTTTTARVAVEWRAPITFVLPFLKSAVGVD